MGEGREVEVAVGGEGLDAGCWWRRRGRGGEGRSGEERGGEERRGEGRGGEGRRGEERRGEERRGEERRGEERRGEERRGEERRGEERRGEERGGRGEEERESFKVEHKPGFTPCSTIYIRQDIMCCHTLPWQSAVVDSAFLHNHLKKLGFTIMAKQVHGSETD